MAVTNVKCLKYLWRLPPIESQDSNSYVLPDVCLKLADGSGATEEVFSNSKLLTANSHLLARALEEKNTIAGNRIEMELRLGRELPTPTIKAWIKSFGSREYDFSDPFESARAAEHLEIIALENGEDILLQLVNVMAEEEKEKDMAGSHAAFLALMATEGEKRDLPLLRDYIVDITMKQPTLFVDHSAKWPSWAQTLLSFLCRKKTEEARREVELKEENARLEELRLQIKEERIDDRVDKYVAEQTVVEQRTEIEQLKKQLETHQAQLPQSSSAGREVELKEENARLEELRLQVKEERIDDRVGKLVVEQTAERQLTTIADLRKELEDHQAQLLQLSTAREAAEAENALLKRKWANADAASSDDDGGGAAGGDCCGDDAAEPMQSTPDVQEPKRTCIEAGPMQSTPDVEEPKRTCTTIEVPQKAPHYLLIQGQSLRFSTRKKIDLDCMCDPKKCFSAHPLFMDPWGLITDADGQEWTSGTSLTCSIEVWEYPAEKNSNAWKKKALYWPKQEPQIKLTPGERVTLPDLWLRTVGDLRACHLMIYLVPEQSGSAICPEPITLATGSIGNPTPWKEVITKAQIDHWKSTRREAKAASKQMRDKVNNHWDVFGRLFSGFNEKKEVKV